MIPLTDSSLSLHVTWLDFKLDIIANFTRLASGVDIVVHLPEEAAGKGKGFEIKMPLLIEWVDWCQMQDTGKPNKQGFISPTTVESRIQQSRCSLEH